MEVRCCNGVTHGFFGSSGSRSDSVIDNRKWGMQWLVYLYDQVYSMQQIHLIFGVCMKFNHYLMARMPKCIHNAFRMLRSAV